MAAIGLADVNKETVEFARICPEPLHAWFHLEIQNRVMHTGFRLGHLFRLRLLLPFLSSRLRERNHDKT